MCSIARHCIVHSAKTKLLAFSPNSPPLLTINSGDEVSFDNRSAPFLNITEKTTDEDLKKLEIKGIQDLEKVTGPIYVDGPVFIKDAHPGDTLLVEILELETDSWGWTGVFPGLGLLKDEIPGPHIKTFNLHSTHAMFKAGVKIPAQPFYGTMGVAPAEGDAHPLFPRNDIGGNFDCRYLGVGSKLYLPVNVEGALFSVGDAHFCQGDGEITGTALETTMKSRFRLSVVKDKKVTSPHYETDPRRVADMHSLAGKGEYGVLTTASTRDEAVKTAVKGVMQWLVDTKDLSREEAYMLFSLAGNLKLMHDLGLEIHTVSASLPLGLFEA